VFGVWCLVFVKTLGLTGGIGMGKSACAELLRQRGIPVIDTDLLARQLVEPGQPALEEVRQTFGSQIIRSDGRLDRQKLAGLVFPDPTARHRLEQILHPRIRHLWKTQIQILRTQPAPASTAPAHSLAHSPAHLLPPSLAVVVIPLLFETNAQNELDATLCVACTPISQRERLRARGWSDSQIDQRIQAQLRIEEKISLANFVIWTEASLDVHAQQLNRVLHSLKDS